VGVNEGEVLSVEEETFVGISFARDDKRLAWVCTDACESTDVFLSAIVPLPRCVDTGSRIDAGTRVWYGRSHGIKARRGGVPVRGREPGHLAGY
jgi:hypothetical protein